MSYHRHDRVKRNGYGPVQDGLKGTTACDKTFEIKVKYQRRFAIAFDFWRYLPYRFAFVKRWIVVSHKWRVVKAVSRHGFFNSELQLPQKQQSRLLLAFDIQHDIWTTSESQRKSFSEFTQSCRTMKNSWQCEGDVKRLPSLTDCGHPFA